jgi:hypothetical protein
MGKNAVGDEINSMGTQTGTMIEIFLLTEAPRMKLRHRRRETCDAPADRKPAVSMSPGLLAARRPGLDGVPLQPVTRKAIAS